MKTNVRMQERVSYLCKDFADKQPSDGGRDEYEAEGRDVSPDTD